MSVSNPFEKYEKLKDILHSYKKVAVAFSGGVDSSLLLYAAGEALDHSMVTALHGASLLNRTESSVEKLFKKIFSKTIQLKIVMIDPFVWPEFTRNDEKRCYHCKKKTYSKFLTLFCGEGTTVLLDGTNTDDLNEDRPGLVVLKELDVKTPLVEAGLNKGDVRFLARSFGLPNHAAPSNSCLATRLTCMPTIEKEDLLLVAEIEGELKKMGFIGCRVRLKLKSVSIEIRQQDFLNFVQRHNRLQVLSICRKLGYKKVFLEISGRQ